MFNLAIDSKLRACDLTKLRVRDVCRGEHVASRATIMQQKTQRPVQFEITEQTRESVAAWIRHAGLDATNFLFPSRIHDSCRHGNMPGWFISGSRQSALTTLPTVPTRCAGPRRL
jgi:hypothetical protein